MSYLEGYGAGDARHEKKVRAGLAVAGVLLVVGMVLFLWLRDREEKKQVQSFIELLRSREYKSAYALWGCTDAKPCRDYAFDKFMEDWGPSSPQANAASAKVNRTKHCNAGIVETIAFSDQHEVELWVERKDKTIGYTPWPVPRQKVPEPVLWAFDQFGPCNMR